MPNYEEPTEYINVRIVLMSINFPIHRCSEHYHNLLLLLLYQDCGRISFLNTAKVTICYFQIIFYKYIFYFTLSDQLAIIIWKT